MDFTGYIRGLAKDFGSKKWLLTLEMEEESALESLQNRFGQETKLQVHIAKWRKKRSLDANAYLWVLCTKMASALNTSKEEVYETMLKRYGVFYKDDNGYVIVTIKADVDTSKIGGHWQACGNSADGKFISYMMIKGSSEYDTKEMSDLLEGVVSEARGLGIDTETDYEHQVMLEEWGRRYEKKKA